jgi:hypothetical protein
MPAERQMRMTNASVLNGAGPTHHFTQPDGSKPPALNAQVFASNQSAAPKAMQAPPPAPVQNKATPAVHVRPAIQPRFTPA